MKACPERRDLGWIACDKARSNPIKVFWQRCNEFSSRVGFFGSVCDSHALETITEVGGQAGDEATTLSEVVTRAYLDKWVPT